MVQNGANSHCGQAVIQIAKKRGLVTVNVIRDREGVQDLKQDLMNLGADHVLTEEEMRCLMIISNVPACCFMS